MAGSTRCDPKSSVFDCVSDTPRPSASCARTGARCPRRPGEPHRRWRSLGRTPRRAAPWRSPDVAAAAARRSGDEDGEFDELGMEGLFLPVTSLWQVLGAIDDQDNLTPLGWWGLPEAMRRVWAPSGGFQDLGAASGRRPGGAAA